MTHSSDARFEVILELEARADAVDALTGWLTANLADTRDYAGCVSVQALRDTDDPTRIVVIGQWLSRAHWQRYIDWREARGDLATVGGLVREPPSFRCFDLLGEWRDDA